jgi:hypothetical protein
VEITQDMTVALPNVETFSLTGKVDGWHIFHLAPHISCPRTKYTSLVQEVQDYHMTPDLEIFPDPASWEAIVRQYSKSPVEHVILEVKLEDLPANLFVFRSSDATVIKLGFEVVWMLSWNSQNSSTSRRNPSNMWRS